MDEAFKKWYDETVLDWDKLTLVQIAFKAGRASMRDELDKAREYLTRSNEPNWQALNPYAKKEYP